MASWPFSKAILNIPPPKASRISPSSSTFSSLTPILPPLPGRETRRRCQKRGVPLHPPSRRSHRRVRSERSRRSDGTAHAAPSRVALASRRADGIDPQKPLHVRGLHFLGRGNPRVVVDRVVRRQDDVARDRDHRPPP